MDLNMHETEGMRTVVALEIMSGVTPSLAALLAIGAVGHEGNPTDEGRVKGATETRERIATGSVYKLSGFEDWRIDVDFLEGPDSASFTIEFKLGSGTGAESAVRDLLAERHYDVDNFEVRSNGYKFDVYGAGDVGMEELGERIKATTAEPIEFTPSVKPDGDYIAVGEKVPTVGDWGKLKSQLAVAEAEIRRLHEQLDESERARGAEQAMREEDSTAERTVSAGKKSKDPRKVRPLYEVAQAVDSLVVALIEDSHQATTEQGERDLMNSRVKRWLVNHGLAL